VGSSTVAEAQQIIKGQFFPPLLLLKLNVFIT
jgi:hypothetical protein